MYIQPFISGTRSGVVGVYRYRHVYPVPDLPGYKSSQNCVQAALIRPFLTDRSKMLIAKLDPSKSSVYKEIKAAILREYKVSAPMYRDKFNELVKADDQTYVMYVSSLFSLINGYMESRKVTKFSELKVLLVSDRVKATLKPHILKYVLSVEAKSTNGWLPPYEIADVVDDYIANHHEPSGPRSGSMQGSSLSQNPKYKQAASSPRSFPRTSGKPNTLPNTGSKNQPANTNSDSARPSVTCWLCGGPHLKKDCPQLSRQNEASNAGGQPPRRVNKVSARSVDQVAIEDYMVHAAGVDEPYTQAQTPARNLVRHTAAECSNLADAHNFMIESGSVDSTECNQCEYVDTPVKFDLQYIPVKVTVVPNSDPQSMDSGGSVSVEALGDSGAELAVIQEEIVQQLDDVRPMGSVTLSGITDTPVKCPLVRLQVHLLGDDTKSLIVITSAVLKDAAEALILPLALVDRLRCSTVDLSHYPNLEL